MEIRIPERSVPIAAECDVLVVGGGPAGIAAAVSAARHHASVILLERFPSVGGQATNALVNIWHTSDRKKQVIFGLVQELIDRCGEGCRRFDDYPERPETHEFEPSAMRLAMHALLDDATVKTYCHLAAMESVIADGRIQGVLADTKTGRKAFLGKIVIDATGDGDVAANAGLPFDFGRKEDGRVQGMTMMFRLCGIDESLVNGDKAIGEHVFEKMKRLKAEGNMPPFLEMAARSYLTNARRHDVSYNMTPVAGDPLDESELTRLSVQARKQVKQYVDFWKSEHPGFAHAEIEQQGFWLGIRESRRIRGLKTFDADMAVKATKQTDAVGHGFWMVDIHDPKGTGHTTWVDQKKESMPPVGGSYHIPLGMCLNDRIPNLAFAGRCASATHEGLASVRIQTHCMVMGQGLGTAAALALDSGRDMTQVDIPVLQRTLKSDGVYLEGVKNE